MNQKSMHNTILKIVMAGLLTAVGILIPMISPLKIVIPPASFTVASHVAVFIAMCSAPAALTHVVFTTVGSLWIKKNPSLLSSWKKSTGLSAILAVIHAACEVLVVLPFYFANPSKYTNGFFTAVVLLVGVGSVVHSMVDFAISYVVWQPLKKSFGVQAVQG